MLSLLSSMKANRAQRTACRRTTNRRSWRPWVEALEDRTLMATGTWSSLTHAIPAEGIENMILLSDGTVMAHGADNSGGYIGNTWYRLTPDSTGSYKNGTWTTLASMHSTRLYYYSAMLKTGNVYVAGGEYPAATPNTAEVYNPVTNIWTTASGSPQGDIGDTPGKVLPNGNIILGDRHSTVVRIYNPTTKTWSLAASNTQDSTSSEESWVLLPEGTILAPDVADQNAHKYVISTNQWVSAGTVPVTLGSSGYEIGAHVLLPDGRVFCLGATGHTALYTPGANPTDPGSWTAGPDIPSGLVADDAPAALLPNGHVLVVADHNNYKGPSSFFEYDPSTNAFTSISAPNSTDASDPCYVFRMLVLPTGQVLFSDDGSSVSIYTPSGAPKSAWKPTITSITKNTDGSYTVKGTQLNGLSEGAYYGDDANSSTNYPLVRLVSAGGAVYYARTFRFSTMGLGTGTATVSARFALPSGLPSGAYSVYAVANGIASSAFSFTFPSAGPAAPAVGDTRLASDAAEDAAPTPASSLGAAQTTTVSALVAGSETATGIDAARSSAVSAWFATSRAAISSHPIGAVVSSIGPSTSAAVGSTATLVSEAVIGNQALLSVHGPRSATATDQVFADSGWVSGLGDDEMGS
jgi:hypothetical protein